MRSHRLTPDQLRRLDPPALVGAVLLAPLSWRNGTLAKGTRVDAALAGEVVAAARGGTLAGDLRLAWPDAGDIHEDEAALRLARAVAGSGITVGSPRQSRVDLTASWDGVLRVRIEALAALNRIDPLEVFTLFHGQAVTAGQTVGAAKVAPHLVAETLVSAGESVARGSGPVLCVDPYLPLEVAAIAAEPLSPPALARFEAAARTKVESLGGRFTGTTLVARSDSAGAPDELRSALASLALERRVPLVLVGGVSAGDPLAPFFEALATLGGEVQRRGVPAHPGSMIWFARLRGTSLLGLPQCGMFSMATAADLVLPRLFTGEAITPETLADLGHGGLLGREMRFRFPSYARDLDSPQS